MTDGTEIAVDHFSTLEQVNHVIGESWTSSGGVCLPMLWGEGFT